MFSQMGPQQSPLADKITGQHITDMLSIQRDGMTNHFEDSKHERKFGMIAFIAFLAFVLILLLMLLVTDNASIATNVLTVLLAAGGTGVGGWGWAKGRSSN